MILGSVKGKGQGTVCSKIQIENTIFNTLLCEQTPDTHTPRNQLNPDYQLVHQTITRTHTRVHASPYILLSSCSLLMFSDNVQCTRYIIMIFNSTLFYINSYKSLDPADPTASNTY